MLGILLFAVMLVVTVLWGKKLGVTQVLVFWAVFIAIGALVGFVLHAHNVSLALKAVVALWFAGKAVMGRSPPAAA